MKKIQLGNSSLFVSKIGLGTINFGTKTSKHLAFELLDTYVEAGGNFLDTANNYAVWNGGDGGESERVIGEWMQARKNRKKIILATKIGALPKSSKDSSFQNMQGLKKETILDAVHLSLQNLQVDYIDLLYLHVDDFSTPQIEVMQTLNNLINEGLIKEIACSNFYTWRIESIRQICKEYNFKFFCAIQQRFSYLTPTIDHDFFPQIALNKDMCAYLEHYQDMTLVAYSPLLKGQYNASTIEKEEYNTLQNKNRLLYLKEHCDNANAWVLKYITNSFSGSIALLTTSNPMHIKEIMEAV